jgi:hypothetical protein
MNQGRMRSEYSILSPSPITISFIAKMSSNGSHPSAMLCQTNVTPRLSAPTLGQDTETLGHQTPSVTAETMSP